MLKTIFISSPYSQGNTEENVKIHLKAFHTLRDKGWIPFAPLLGHFLEEIQPRPYEDWIEYDLAWLKKCDAYVRLPSTLKSQGCDIEEDQAKKIYLPRFYDLESVPELSNWVDTYKLYVNHILPTIAHATKKYPIYHNHCWARILLDNYFGGVWYDFVEKPAQDNLAEEDAKLICAMAELCKNNPVFAEEYNIQSLVWRGKNAS